VSVLVRVRVCVSASEPAIGLCVDGGSGRRGRNKKVQFFSNKTRAPQLRIGCAFRKKLKLISSSPKKIKRRHLEGVAKQQENK